jgi:hypothetical protein
VGQREADRRHRPKEDRSWCRSGRFPVERPPDCHSVRCGVCLEDFAQPHAKARHLVGVHHAIIERHVNGTGIIEYFWRLP